jgi:ribosomal protein S27E
MNEHSQDDPDPSFPQPQRRISKADTTAKLAEIAAESGGQLHAEGGGRTVAPMPTRLADGSFVNRTCPRCGGDRFAHSYGDELCGCASCGAVLDVDELVV